MKGGEEMKNFKESLKQIPPEHQVAYAMLAISLLGMIGTAIYSVVTGNTVNTPIPVIGW